MRLLETGIPNLDRILGGGLPERDQLLVVGPAGAGKTTLGLQMVFHAAARGKPALYVSTVSEPPNKLLRHSRAFRFVDEALIGRQLFLVSLYPLIKQDLEKALQELARQVKEQQAALVVIDGLMAIRDLHAGTQELRPFFDQRRRFGYLAALIGLLRNQGSTALMTREVAKEVGPELDFSDTPLALLAENLLLLRHVQFENELYRILSVLKMRESSFDPGVRQYTITDQGLKMFSKEDTARGVLAGIAHWPAGARVKRKPDED